MQIVIPMAGRGQRFRDAGYDRPKPFIDVDGMEMFRRVMSNLRFSTLTPTYLLALSEHATVIHPAIGSLVHVLEIGAVTEGAACTILLAESHVDAEQPMLVANADQWLDWSPEHFADFVFRDGCDGAIVTFRASGEVKWSYAAVREDGTVAMVAEKNPISDEATVGLYYWKRAGDCFQSVRAMMAKDMRVNNEFYLAPSFNEMILDGARVIAYPVPRMWSMGTPEDLKRTLEAKPWRR